MSEALVPHHIPGRLRLKIPKAKGDLAFLDRVKEVLGSVEGVRGIEVNSLTGSVLVRYDPRYYDDFHDNLHQHVVHRHNILSMEADGLSDTVDEFEKGAEYLASHSTSAKAVIDFLRGVDKQVKLASDNAVDLKVMVPLGLAVYSLFEMGLTAATPVWVTLGLFSFNHFVELHSRDLYVEPNRSRSLNVSNSPS